MKRFVLLALLAFFIGITLGVIVTSVLDNYSLLNIRVSNVTSNSATITWESDIPTYGEVYYGTEETIHAAKFMQGEKSYDDRDIEPDGKGGYRLKPDRGKRQMHHVTIRNLDPEKEYFFSINKNFRVEKVEQESIPNSSFKTGPVIDNLQTPDPLYGEIKVPGNKEVLVYMYLSTEDEIKTNIISTYLAENGTYTFDVNNLRKPDFTAFRASSEENLNIVLEIQVPIDQDTAIKTFEFKNYQPLDTILLQETESRHTFIALAYATSEETDPQELRAKLIKTELFYTPPTQPSNKPQEEVKTNVQMAANQTSIAKSIPIQAGPIFLGPNNTGLWPDQNKCSVELREKYTQLFANKSIREINPTLLRSYYQEFHVCIFRIPICLNSSNQYTYCPPNPDATPQTYTPPKVINWDKDGKPIDITRTFNPKAKTLTNKGVFSLAYAQEESTFIDDNTAIVEPGNYSLQLDGTSVERLAINADDDSVVEVVLFDDTNKNGLMDEGEKEIETEQEIDLKREADTVIYKLDAGWNLLSLPIISNDNITTAQKLLNHFNEQGAKIQHIAKFENGQFVMYSQRDDGSYSNDFNLVPGQGYFVFNYNPSLVEIKGNKLNESVQITLNNGWNLVGLFTTKEEYDAETSIKDMNAQGFKTDTLSKYEDGLYNSVVLEDEVLYGNSFKILGDQGYFVRVVEGGGKGSFKP